MDWSDVKVSRDMHDGMKRIIRNIDVTGFSASMFEFFWRGVKSSYMKGGRERIIKSSLNDPNL